MCSYAPRAGVRSWQFSMQHRLPSRHPCSFLLVLSRFHICMNVRVVFYRYPLRPVRRTEQCLVTLILRSPCGWVQLVCLLSVALEYTLITEMLPIQFARLNSQKMCLQMISLASAHFTQQFPTHICTSVCSIASRVCILGVV